MSRPGHRSRPARADLPLALLPALLATHSVIEAFVWRGERGQLSEAVSAVDTYAYVLIAFAVLPTFVPFAVWWRECDPRRRRALSVLTAIGAVVSVVMVHAIVNGPFTATIEGHFIAYCAGVPMKVLTVGAYVLTTCGAGLLSSSRAIVGFAVAEAVAVVVLVSSQALTSLWCGWAAITSGAIALMLRRSAVEQVRVQRV